MKQKKKKQETKRIKCIQCEADITVLKWAPKRQFCDNCKKAYESPPDDTASIYSDPAPKQVTPVNKFKHAQEVLDGLGFILTSRGYNKQYQDGEAIVKVEPIWDKGTSMDSNYTLEAIIVTRQEIVPVTDINIHDRVPAITQLDISTLLRELDIKIPGSASPTHIDTIRCAGCGKDVADWIQNVRTGEFLCLDQCAPTKKPVKI
jgi:hypothetical protein